jgi:hypothetical protein
MKELNPNKQKFPIKRMSDFLSLGFKGSLFVGILISFIYFFSIGYTPVGDFQSFIHLIFFITLLSLCIFGLIILAFVMAPLSWAELLKMPDTCALITGLEGKENEDFSNAYRAGEIEITAAQRHSISRWYMGSNLAYLALTWIIVLYASGLLQVWFLFGLVCVFFSCLSLLINNKDNKEGAIGKIISISKIIVFSISSGLLLLFLVFILGHFYSATDPKTADNFFVILLSCLIVVFSCLVLLPQTKPKNFYRWALTVGLGTMLVIFMLMGAWGSTAGTIMRVLKLGAMQNASIIVDKTGCQILATQGVDLNCKSSNGTNGSYLVTNVHVLWRVGEYAIRFRGKDDQIVQVIFPASHVVGLVVNEKKAEDPKNKFNNPVTPPEIQKEKEKE